MHPILIKIGPIPIHTYGFLIATGFMVGVSVIKRLAIRSKLDVDKILDVSFWGLLVGLLGARILFVITRFESYMRNPIEIFKVWEGGLVFLGGLLLVIPFVIWYLTKHKVPIWKSLDAFAPGLTIGHAFGRFGCLAAGCCYGKPTGSSYGIKLYSELVEPNLRGIPLHPTQIYEAVSLFILFLGLIFIHYRKKFDGQVAVSYLIAYPIIRSIIEVFRGDLIRGFVIEDFLSTSQFISILIFAAAVITLIIRLKQIETSHQISKKQVQA